MSPNSRDCSHTEKDIFQGQDFTHYDSPGNRDTVYLRLVLLFFIISDGDNDDVDTVGVENLANQLSSSSVA